MRLPDEIKNLPKEAMAFSKEKPANLDAVWPWGLRLVALMRPVANFRGDFESVALFDSLAQACEDKNETALDAALLRLNEINKTEIPRAFRSVKGGLRLIIRPFTNRIRKALGKKELKGFEGL